uniref:Uncharacterized protein n=1 Tax=Chlamydomonas leiostraca TaxID=1034604 RepID=A0A7S0R9N2_9CHLO
MAGLDATVAQISAVAAAAIPGPHQFSEVEHNRVPQVGPKLWTNEDGSEFVTEAEQGLSGLLGRFIEVPKEEFQKLKEHALQEQMQLDLMGGAELGCCPKREFSIFGLPMIYPVGGFTFAWMTLISLLDITYAAFWVPMNVAFCSTRYGDLSTGCTKADLAGGVG